MRIAGFGPSGRRAEAVLAEGEAARESLEAISYPNAQKRLIVVFDNVILHFQTDR